MQTMQPAIVDNIVLQGAAHLLRPTSSAAAQSPRSTGSASPDNRFPLPPKNSRLYPLLSAVAFNRRCSSQGEKREQASWIVRERERAQPKCFLSTPSPPPPLSTVAGR
jgi:hypothetical protein